MKSLLICALLCCPGLLAQKVPIAGSAGRLLQVIDLQPLWGEEGHAEAAEVFAGIDTFLRSFVEPPLGPDDDVRLLGRHQLAVLGSAQQAAFVENLVAKAVQNKNAVVTIDVKLLVVAPAAFERQVRPLLGKQAAEGADVPLQGVLGAVPMQTLRRVYDDKVACRSLHSMALSVLLFQRAHMKVGEEISYIDDFELEGNEGSKVATPLPKTLFDGQAIDVMATILGKDQIAVQCEVTQTEVQKPLPEAKVSLGAGDPVTIQLPRVSTVHFQTRAVHPAGSSVVVAARRKDGDWLVGVLTAVLGDNGQGGRGK